MAKYDYLIVGSGLFGAVFAHQMKKHGRTSLVIDRRDHLGGNIHCDDVDGINVHHYGPHIFHTNDRQIWDFVNDLVEFNRFTYSPMAEYEGKLYNLPFNMNTFSQIWGVKTPGEAEAKLQEEIRLNKVIKPRNLEEQAISLVGREVYEILIKGYTEKQWGRKATALPPFIIKRLPVRFTFDNNYFNDRFQGIPIGGYNRITEALLDGIETRLNIDFRDHRAELGHMADKVVYTGPLDELYDYKYGELQYRSLEFEHERLEMKNFQGVAAVNYTSAKVPFTRIVEHKHFEFGTQDHTVITKEYPLEWKKGIEPYYPINDQLNQDRHKKYLKLAERDGLIIGGRLAEYRYYDMHQVIAASMAKVNKIVTH